MLNIGEFARLGQVSPRMLRHYDQLGLLKPERVDPETGYRSTASTSSSASTGCWRCATSASRCSRSAVYSTAMLPLEQLRGMLRLRRAQLEQIVADEQARLRRVEAHLRAIEGSNTVNAQDIVIKPTQPLRVAEATGIAGGLDPEHLGPLFEQLAPMLGRKIAQAGARPGTMIGYYDEPDDDGSVGVHVAFEIGDQAVQPATASRS